MSILNEHSRTVKSNRDRRPYRMRRRAELVDQTRLRITEAAVRLHTTVGPANTSIAGIAEAAGVTRLTVYRHFADLDEIFVACTGHWRALHPAPDPAAWSSIPDLPSRARLAIGELYAWYAEVGQDLLPLYRDLDAWPPRARERLRAEASAMADVIVGDAAGTGGAARCLRAVVGHATSLFTWRSLVDGGLTSPEAAELAARWVIDAGSVPVPGLAGASEREHEAE